MVLMRTAFSHKYPGKFVVLLRTAARFSQKYFFKKHPSGDWERRGADLHVDVATRDQDWNRRNMENCFSSTCHKISESVMKFCSMEEELRPNRCKKTSLVHKMLTLFLYCSAFVLIVRFRALSTCIINYHWPLNSPPGLSVIPGRHR